MHMVDDATSSVLCEFSYEETIWAAAGVLRSWIECYGIPRALYTDWKNVYVRAATEAEQCAGQTSVTQFGRMCEKLDIRIIAAISPQARAHGVNANQVFYWGKLYQDGWARVVRPSCYRCVAFLVILVPEIYWNYLISRSEDTLKAQTSNLED